MSTFRVCRTLVTLGFKKKWVKCEMAAGSHFEKNKTTKNLVIKCDMSFLTNFGRLRRAHLWPNMIIPGFKESKFDKKTKFAIFTP